MQNHMSDFMGDAETLPPTMRACVNSYYDLHSIAQREARLCSVEMAPHDYHSLACGDFFDRHGWLAYSVLLEQGDGAIFFLAHLNLLRRVG